MNPPKNIAFFKHGFYYAEIITQIVSSVEKQFHDLRASLVFQAPCFNLGCFALAFRVKMALTEWDTLEVYVQPLISNNEEDTT